MRSALVVTTSEYEDPGLRDLTGPLYDARALADILKDPRIADFEVTVLLNEPNYVVGAAIGDFYRSRKRNDLTLLYISGHGLKDDSGHLYFAMRDTRRENLLFTALSAHTVNEAMEGCFSQQKVLILDCCYSGAFGASSFAKGDPAVHTLEKFRGQGRIVLTASDSTQYAFESDPAAEQAYGSIFTRFLVEGISTGSADIDLDGDISVSELYSFAHDRVLEVMPNQRPKKHEEVEGNIVIAQNVAWELPSHWRNSIDSPIPTSRLAALKGLAHLHRIGNDIVRARVKEEVDRLTDDDSRSVSAEASRLIRVFEADAAGVGVEATRPADRESTQRAERQEQEATQRAERQEQEAAQQAARQREAAERQRQEQETTQQAERQRQEQEAAQQAEQQRQQQDTPPDEPPTPLVPPHQPKGEASRLIVIVALAALVVVGTLVAIMLRDPEPTNRPRTSSHPPSATTASPARTGRAPLLVDDFHTRTHGWEGPGGRYVDEMYRIDVESRISKTSSGKTSSPRNASNVYPSAPSDLRIEVEARSLDPLDDGSSYGVICHLNEDTNDRYQFTIGEGENTVRITKLLGGRAQFLAVASVASLNATDANKIRADCVNGRDTEEGAVHLVFRLNGQIVAEVTDKDQPLLDGTIGVRAFSRQGGIRAAFDNFVVTPA